VKNLSTLVEDIYDVVDGKGGWDKVVSDHLASRLSATIDRRLSPSEEEHKPSLRMSNLGTPCTRKLWYSINQHAEAEPLRPATKLKFLYGDILEDLLLSLAEAAGHKVEGEQDRMEIDGIVGHRDAVIDGMTIDVKSASTYAFQKFKDHKLRDDDPFGYIDQLSSYVYAAKDDPIVKDKERGAFLVVDKQHGTLCLDVYDFTKEIWTKKDRVEEIKSAVNSSNPPERSFSPVPEGKSGNMKLPFQCSYCDHKFNCHDNVRTFLGSRGPLYLTDVKREPKMKEVT